MNNSTKVVLFSSMLIAMLICIFIAYIAFTGEQNSFGNLFIYSGVIISFLFIIITAVFVSDEWKKN